MTEWYVYCENDVPRHIIMGRREAIKHLTDNFRLTYDEGKRIRGFLEGGPPDLSAPFRIVGYERDNGEWLPDRTIIRVTGPGALV